MTKTTRAAAASQALSDRPPALPRTHSTPPEQRPVLRPAPLDTELVTDTAGFAALQPAWDRLAQGDTPALFRAFTWQFEWWRALGGGRQLRLVVARDGGRVTGILPLFEETVGGVRRLALIASAGGGSDYLDLLCGTDTVRERLLLGAAAIGADLLELDDLDSASPTLPLVRRLAQARGETATQLVRYPCPFIPVRMEFERYLATQVARRETLKRREKWFAQQPGFRITCESEPEAVAPFLARFYRLHAARWRDDGGSQAFSDARLTRFHAQVAQRFADEGRLRLWTLWVAGEAVAVAYAFDDGDRSLYYQSGFLPAWGARSAGAVLFARYVEDAFRRGLREVDLLRGAEPYKGEWTREGRQTVSARWALTPKGARALALREAKATVRAGVKRLLPEDVRLGLARVVREGRMRGMA